MYQTAEKFDGEIKFGSLAVGVETAKLKFANIIFVRTHNVNDVILLGPAPLCLLYMLLAQHTLVSKFANSWLFSSTSKQERQHSPINGPALQTSK